MPSCLAKGETANQKSDPFYREKEHRAKKQKQRIQAIKSKIAGPPFVLEQEIIKSFRSEREHTHAHTALGCAGPRAVPA
jgi:hypothetical protein